MGPSPDMVVWALAAVAVQAIGTVTLWLRLRSNERCERDRWRHLVTAARELPPGSQLEERFSEGGGLAITTGSSGSGGDPRVGA